MDLDYRRLPWCGPSYRYRDGKTRCKHHLAGPRQGACRTRNCRTQEVRRRGACRGLQLGKRSRNRCRPRRNRQLGRAGGSRVQQCGPHEPLLHRLPDQHDGRFPPRDGRELLRPDQDCLPFLAGHDQARFRPHAAHHERYRERTRTDGLRLREGRPHQVREGFRLQAERHRRDDERDGPGLAPH